MRRDHSGSLVEVQISEIVVTLDASVCDETKTSIVLQ